LLVPCEAGGLENCTNQVVGVSFLEPPIECSALDPASAGVAANTVTQREASTSRRLVRSIVPFRRSNQAARDASDPTRCG
jgi:hypothetical protein